MYIFIDLHAKPYIHAKFETHLTNVALLTNFSRLAVPLAEGLSSSQMAAVHQGRSEQVQKCT